MEKSSRRDIRQDVINAAVRLVETTGPATLTLEGVAKEAGVSKGGLLHYFKTKEALLTEVVQHHVGLHETAWESALSEARTRGTNQTLDATFLIQIYIDRSFSGQSVHHGSARTLFGIAAYHPPLLEPVKAYFQRRISALEKDDKTMRHMLAFILLADGLSLFDSLDIPPFPSGIRKELHTEVRDLAAQLLTPDQQDQSPKKPATTNETFGCPFPHKAG